ELVGVAGEAVLARHLAAPVGVDGPAERHRSGAEPVHEARRSKFPILDAAPLVERRPHPTPHPRCWNSRLDPHSRHLLSISVQEKSPGTTRDPRADLYRRQPPPGGPPPGRGPRSPRGPPDPRCGWGRASSTTRFRSRKRRPFSISIAFDASSLVAISTNPNPRGRPVN